MRYWLQITSGRGPDECCWVTARVYEYLIKEAEQKSLQFELLDAVPGERTNTFKSILIALDGDAAASLCSDWSGVILWVGISPYRPRHKRKNWYVGVSVIAPPAKASYSEKDVRVETMRASGPGGQHVNKVSSAVRVTHMPTGIVATAQEERSQFRNRALALARLHSLLEAQQTQKQAQTQQQLWNTHNDLQRGNPIRVFEGPSFVEKRKLQNL